MQRSAWLVGATALCMPLAAHAHAIRPWMAAMALSPVLVLLLAVLLGRLRRSWLVGAMHCALIVGWVIWFWTASNVTTNDYLIWAPLVAYLIHSVVIVALLSWHPFTRRPT